jgi:hypothetical protein
VRRRRPRLLEEQTAAPPVATGAAENDPVQRTAIAIAEHSVNTEKKGPPKGQEEPQDLIIEQAEKKKQVLTTTAESNQEAKEQTTEEEEQSKDDLNKTEPTNKSDEMAHAAEKQEAVNKDSVERLDKPPHETPVMQEDAKDGRTKRSDEEKETSDGTIPAAQRHLRRNPVSSKALEQLRIANDFAEAVVKRTELPGMFLLTGLLSVFKIAVVLKCFVCKLLRGWNGRKEKKGPKKTILPVSEITIETEHSSTVSSVGTEEKWEKEPPRASSERQLRELPRLTPKKSRSSSDLLSESNQRDALVAPFYKKSFRKKKARRGLYPAPVLKL